MERYEDPYVYCPYDSKHRVPRSRLQRHLVNCQQNYPPLSICPYNATHRYPEDKIKDHMAICPAKEQFLTDEKPPSTTSMMATLQPVPQQEYLKEDDSDYESWD